MGAQDRTEKVLRDMHVLFSKAMPYDGSAKNVIVDKNIMMDLLKELNECMYDMMEEYELTVKSRDKANRELQKQTDDMVFSAQRKAEDVYAASIMYTDNVFNESSQALKALGEDMEKLFEEYRKKLKDSEKAIKHDQIETKSHLNDLIDTQKYLRLIDEENIRIAKEKAEGTEEEFDAPKYSAPEVRINKEYFVQSGLMDEDAVDEPAIDPQMSEDLDAEYFAWQEGQTEKKETRKGLGGLFGKKK